MPKSVGDQKRPSEAGNTLSRRCPHRRSMPDMIFHALIIGLTLIAARGWASTPDSVAGFVLYESGNTEAHSSFQFAVSLNASGSFQGLFFRSTTGSPAVGGPIKLFTPEDGTWTYKKVDDTTATLTLLSSTGFQPFSGNLTLRFLADDSGFVLGSSLSPGILSVGFRLVPLATRAPLSNCSNRSFVRAGGLAFTGFVVTSGGSGFVLVRAVGPSLSQFGITDALRNPRLNVVSANSGQGLASNDDWGSESAPSINRTGAIVGAFPMATGSKDSAVILSLSPGAYVAQVDSPESDDSGQALIEVYVLP